MSEPGILAQLVTKCPIWYNDSCALVAEQADAYGSEPYGHYALRGSSPLEGTQGAVRASL